MGFTSYTCAKTNLPVLNSNSWGSMPETYEVVMLFKNGDRVSGCYDGYGRVELEGGGLIESIHDALENKEAKLVLQKFCAPEDTFESIAGFSQREPGQGHFHSQKKIRQWYDKGGFKTYAAYCKAEEAANS